jgi:uncharacterized GH25 family protein
LVFVVGTCALQAHDLFLKPPTHFVGTQERVAIELINGTFQRSENVISRDRMLDVSVVGVDGEMVHPPESAWHDHPEASWLEFETGSTGTYVVGVSTKAKVLKLSGKDFDGYLQHDGVLDVFEQRKASGKLGQAARERYSKHVKALLQVGDDRSDNYRHRLGYPVEFVPQQNPFALSMGETLSVQFLLAGTPVAGQRVYASPEGFHGHDELGRHVEAVSTRTDEDGMARIRLSREGRWYVRTIHMAEVNEPDVDYQSNWATLTFEVQE